MTLNLYFDLKGVSIFILYNLKDYKRNLTTVKIATSSNLPLFFFKILKIYIYIYNIDNALDRYMVFLNFEIKSENASERKRKSFQMHFLFLEKKIK